MAVNLQKMSRKAVVTGTWNRTDQKPPKFFESGLKKAFDCSRRQPLLGTQPQ